MRINRASIVCFGLLACAAGPAQSPSDLVVISPWFVGDEIQDSFAAILENRSDHYFGGITTRVALRSDADTYSLGAIKPIKTQLAPGERTFVGAIIGSSGHPFFDDITFEPSGVEISAEEYRSVGEPDVISIEEYASDEGLLIHAEIANPGPRPYAADPDSGLALRAGLLVLDRGKIVGVAPELDTEPWGHLGVGSKATIKALVSVLGSFDEIQLFFSAEPLPADRVPAPLEVEDLEWSIVDPSASDDGLVRTRFLVRNLTDESVEPSIRWVARAADGRWLGRDACYPDAPLPPGGAMTCVEELPDYLLATGDVGEVRSVSVHVGSPNAVARTSAPAVYFPHLSKGMMTD